MPFVHLANGNVEHFTQDEYNEAFGDAPANALTVDGVQSQVIGVYNDDVQIEAPKDTGKGNGK